MVERKKGAIINISSFSAAIPTPLLSVYSASKSYVDLFSQGLAKEYLSKGITVQCVLPGHVVSKLSKIRRPSLNVPSPSVFVRLVTHSVLGAILNLKFLGLDGLWESPPIFIFVQFSGPYHHVLIV